MAPSRTSRGTGLGAIHQRRRRNVAEHAAVEHQQLARSHVALKSSTSRSGPGAGGPPGRLADVDVSGRPVAATSRAMPRCDV